MLLVLAGVASVAFGVRSVGLDEIVGGVLGSTDTIGEAAVAKRVPRTALAMIVGAALAVSGAVMQGVTRNPLADPGILGVTTGAALFVVAGIAFFGLASPTSYIWVAIAGAALAASFVYAVGSLGRGGATPLKLALAGAASSAAFTSLISAILLPRIDVMDSFRFWQIGGVGGAQTEKTLQVPHLCRLLVGVDHRWLLPFSAVLGAALLTTADVVGRLVARPAEVDVGIVTALLGAPVFIAIVRRQKVRAL